MKWKKLPPPPPFLAVLIEREVMWIRKFIDNYRTRKLAIFSAGLYARKFYTWLSGDYGVEPEFFIDNNLKFIGQSACGKPILLRPWENMTGFNKDYFVLISTKDTYFHKIAKQLDEAGISYMSSDAFQVAHLWNRYKSVVEWLDDDLSKSSYLGALWYWLTYSNKYIATVDNQYFAVKQFIQTVDEVVCDIGAFVGDTTEEYVKRGLGRCKIFAFEPDIKLRSSLGKRVARLNSEWGFNDNMINIVSAGVGKENGFARFAGNGNHDSHIITDYDEAGVELEIYALDDYFRGKEQPTLIKADIEGSELDMLIGAKETIKRAKPKMALCIYHSCSDFVIIPEYIHCLYPNYCLKVRNHSDKPAETVLYCHL